MCVEKRYTNLKFKNKTIDFSLRYRYDGNVRFSIAVIAPNQAERYENLHRGKPVPGRRDKGVIEMINFEEELKKFHPSLEIEDAEDAIYNQDLTDMADLLVKMVKESKEKDEE